MIYNLVIYIYLFGVKVAGLFSAKPAKMVKGHREVFDILRNKIDKNARYIWFHAASLGEFEQGRPLIERIRKEHPEYKILQTFFSPSGYEVRKNYQGADRSFFESFAIIYCTQNISFGITICFYVY